MNPRPRPISLLLYLLFWALVSLCTSLANFEHGKRPANGIIDPIGLLDQNTLLEISAPLPRLLSQENIEIIVVILDDLEDAPPEFVAKRFADAWCSAPLHAVVLHSPGHPDSPWIVPGGEILAKIQRSVVTERLAIAHRNTSREPTDPQKIRAATIEAADMLRFWANSSVIREEMMDTIRSTMVGKAIKEHKSKAARLYAIAASAILLVICLLLLLLWWRKPTKITFPNFHPPHRLGAPHSGGNHVIIHFSNPDPPNP